MKLLLIIAMTCLWSYLVILITYTMIEIYWVSHPDRYKQAVIWELEREREATFKQGSKHLVKQLKTAQNGEVITS